jgi:hypothetical protein
MAKNKKSGLNFTIPFEDPDLPAVLEFYAARRATSGDLKLAQALRDQANEVRAAQAQAQAEPEKLGRQDLESDIEPESTG